MLTPNPVLDLDRTVWPIRVCRSRIENWIVVYENDIF